MSNRAWMARMVCVLAVLAICLLPAQSQADPQPADPTIRFAPALEQLIDNGLTPQETIGKLLWSRGPADFARAYVALNLPEDALAKIFTNARAANATELATLAAKKDVDALTTAIGNAGVGKKRLLNALRFWLLTDGKEHIGVRDVLALVKRYQPAVTDDDLASVLAEDFPHNQIPTERPKALTGKLETIDGVRVLKLWGTPFERGYAHGKLLGPEIMNLWRRYVWPLAQFRGGYKRVAEYQDVVFDFPKEHLDELKGLVLGMRDAIPEADRLNSPLGRDIALVDMKVGNTLSDWAEFGCSSVTLWGDKTADGNVLTGRNLDYMTGASRVLVGGHLVVVHASAAATSNYPARKGWTSVTFLGAIGCYTGINEDGVTAMMHNTPGHHLSTIDAIPRSISQRAALERCDAANLPGSFAEVLRNLNLLVPSNIHVSWPRNSGDGTDGFAAAMEMDGYSVHERGVTIRRPADKPDEFPGDFFVVTNHFCKRYHEPLTDDQPAAKPIPGNSGVRMNTLYEAANAAESKTVTPAVIREWLQRVGHSGSVHSVVFEPDARAVNVMLPGPSDRGGPWSEMKRLSVRDMLRETENLARQPLRDF